MDPVAELTDSDVGQKHAHEASHQVPPAKRSRNGGNNGKTMEVFAGSGNLSRALQEVGFATTMVDLRYKAEDDMSKVQTIRRLCEQVQSSGIKYVHMAPPCNTYSLARFPKIRPCAHCGLMMPMMSFDVVECCWSSAFLPLVPHGGRPRSVVHPEGLPDLSPKFKAEVRIANKITKNTFKLATMLCKLGVAVSVENPGSSVPRARQGLGIAMICG